MLKANQFIPPVPVYKMKYLLERQYSNHQFINFINTYIHVNKLVQKYKLASLFDMKSIAEIECRNLAFTSSAYAKVKLACIKW